MQGSGMVLDRHGNVVDDEIVPDGGIFRVPASFMDVAPGLQALGLRDGLLHDGAGNLAGHKPGFCFGGKMVHQTMRATNARDAYVKSLSTAWRNPGPARAAPVKPQPSKPPPAKDSRAAHQKYVEWLSNAWRTP